jgi:hypothetical protein
MRRCPVLVLSLFATAFIVPAAYAQGEAEALTPQQTGVACASPAAVEAPPSDALRIVGAQETTLRGMYGPRDLLLLSGGKNSGLQLGQRFFIRRPLRFGWSYTSRPQGTTTVGWLRVVSMNDTMAIAMVDHACDAILQNDYLVPFTPPAVPAEVDRTESFEDLDFSALAQVVAGNENRSAGAAGDFMLIDRGADQGVTPGARFAIYRDLHTRPLPLTEIGEATVISAAKDSSLVRITRTRDAVLAGDYLVPRKSGSHADSARD